MREQKWVASVRKIIAEYQTKLSNVARHTLVDKASLRQQEKDIAAVCAAITICMSVSRP